MTEKKKLIVFVGTYGSYKRPVIWMHANDGGMTEYFELLPGLSPEAVTRIFSRIQWCALHGWEIFVSGFQRCDVGDTLEIYHDPITQQKPEGWAVVRRILSENDDKYELEVHFLEDKDDRTVRRIWRK